MATKDEKQFLPRPDRPLKILTIDGGGLQAIATLLILDKVMDKVASKDVSGTFRRPRPCDIFDTIAGIGAGGWLAILLGRFHMDITTCLTEWYKLMDVIQPKSKVVELKNRVHHQYYDPKQLVEHINRLTELYGTGHFMAEEENADRSRCKHVFVAGLPAAGANEKYNLFRTYQLPKHAKAGSLLPGPESPGKFTIASAFGVTGAAKYFTPTWKENMKGGRKIKFRDNDFPIPHNITELALDEMWGLYGPEAPVCLVVNIGPGLPNNADIEGIAGIARRITWPPGIKPGTFFSKLLVRKESTTSTLMNEAQGTEDPGPAPGLEILQQVESPTQYRQPTSPKTSSRRVDSHDIAAKMQKKETEIEQAIKAKLHRRYVDARYYRLALGESPPGAPQCDALNPRRSTEAVDRYCKSANGMLTMERVGEHFEKTFAAERGAAMQLTGGFPREVTAAA